MKRAIKYLRVNQAGQTSSSIEKQHIAIDQWLSTKKVKVVDSFIDDSKSPKSFDQPN